MDYYIRSDAEVSAGVNGCEGSHAGTCEEPFTGAYYLVFWRCISPWFYLFFLIVIFLGMGRVSLSFSSGTVAKE
jgi:hypothetical protein